MPKKTYKKKVDAMGQIIEYQTYETIPTRALRLPQLLRRRAEAQQALDEINALIAEFDKVEKLDKQNKKLEIDDEEI